MQASVARAAVVGLTILGLSGCQSGGGWSWPWASKGVAQQQYPNTAEGLSSAAATSNQGVAANQQTAAPSVQLPAATATPYSATQYSAAAAKGAPAYQQPGGQPPAYSSYPESPTSYAGGAGSSGYPSTTSGNAGRGTTGYAEAAGGYANPAAGAYPKASTAMAPQEGYYGSGVGGSSAAAPQTPNYGNYNVPSSPAEAAGGYPQTSPTAAPYASTPSGASSYPPPESNAPAAPADYANGGGLRTADNRAATGSRYDGGAPANNTSAYPNAAFPSGAPAGAGEQPDRYSKYGSSAPATNDASLNASRYPAVGPTDAGTGSAYPATAPTTSYPSQAMPSSGGGRGGASGASGSGYHPGGTKDYLPPAGNSQGSAIPGGYGSSSSAIRPAHYEATAGEAAPAAAQIPAAADRYATPKSDDAYGSMPSAVTPPEVSVPTVTR